MAGNNLSNADRTRQEGTDANRDPISGAPGAHPIGTGVGLAGKGVAESVNPTTEDAYWRENYKTRPYATGATYDEFAPAYRYGWESRPRYEGRRFDDVENDLERGWDKVKGNSRLGWEKAKMATRDAWHRVERAIPGDADRDGR